MTIALIEGRGIWLELNGSLTDGSLDEAALRLDRLAKLAFSVVVLGAADVETIDLVGSDVISAFVDRVAGGPGSVVIVDPAGRIWDATGGRLRATFTTTPPCDGWWLV